MLLLPMLHIGIIRALFVYLGGRVKFFNAWGIVCTPFLVAVMVVVGGRLNLLSNFPKEGGLTGPQF